MVSRTSRQHQSQPRAMAQPPTEPWENVSDNVRSQLRPTTVTGMDRRAQSSIRYTSNGRQSMGSVRAPPQKVPVVRPRAISAGRATAPTGIPQQYQHQQQQDDPNEITRQILDLRERRESSSQLKRRPMETPMQPRPIPGISYSNSKSESHQTPASPQGHVIKTAGSNLSQEEIVAEERLKRAEK